MKTQVNQHNSQLVIIAFLVSTSILLLAFGIYKTITLQNNHLLSTHNQASIIPSIPSFNLEYGDLLYSHVYLEESVESPLEIKEWMTNYSSWITESSSSNIETSSTELYEEPLALEEWMTNYSSWMTNTNAHATYETEEYYNEAPLDVENWMTNLLEWDIIPYSNINNEINKEEPELELEPWMINDSAWHKSTSEPYEETNLESSLILKEWMISIDDWEVPVVSTEQFAKMNNNLQYEELTLEPWMFFYNTWVD